MKAIYLADTLSKSRPISQLLQRKNIGIEVVHNVTAALRNLMTSRYELIISELKLKDLDAYDLMTQIIKINQRD